jgi:hypothetical protein
MSPWLLIPGLLAGLYGLHRLALWMEAKGWIYYVKQKPDSSSLGTALLELHQLARPSVKHVQEARTKRTAQQDDQGGPDTAGSDGETPNTPSEMQPS